MTRPTDQREPPGGIHLTAPAYTIEALRSGVEGFVELSATVDERGIPRDVTVIQGLGYGLDDQAVSCVRDWRVPIPHAAGSRVRLYVKFELPPERIATPG